MNGPDEQHQRLERATAHLDPPFAVVDLDAFDRNAADLARRATGVPIRVASKSVRVRELVDRTVAAQGFSGVMTFALREAIWLAQHGHRDLLMGYPTVDRAALQELAGDEELRRSIVLMVDHPAQLALVRAAGATAAAPVRVCLDIDASLRVGPLHLGVRRSPVHRPDQAADAAAAIARAPGRRADRPDVLRRPDRRPAGLQPGGPVRQAPQRRRPGHAAYGGLASRARDPRPATDPGQCRGDRQPRGRLRRPGGDRADAPARACSRPGCSTATGPSRATRRRGSRCRSCGDRTHGSLPPSAAATSPPDRQESRGSLGRPGRRD